MRLRPNAPVWASLGLLWLLACTSSNEPADGDGTAGVPVEGCRGVAVSASEDLRAITANGPAGTTFCLAPGTYRISAPLTLKEGQDLFGTGGGVAIISGAKTVTATEEGAYWVITGQTSLGQSAFSGTPNQCRPIEGVDPKGMCVYRDQVFLDDVSLWQVGSLGELSPNEFYWDYDANRIYLADDPGGRKLEVSVTPDGISGGPDVQMENVVVEKVR